MGKLEPMICPFFSVTLCTGICSLTDIIGAAKRDMSYSHPWRFLPWTSYNIQNSCYSSTTSLAEVVLLVLPGPVTRPVRLQVLSSVLAAVKWAWSVFGKNLFTYLYLCLYLRVHTGRSQLPQLGKHRQPAVSPKASSDGVWSWECAKSVAFEKGDPILVTVFSQ